MSVRTMARVWAESKVTKAAELLILLAIADFADDDGRAYPSINTLAEKCRVTRTYAKDLLTDLQHSGELVIIVGKGPWGANVYQLLPGGGVAGATGGGEPGLPPHQGAGGELGLPPGGNQASPGEVSRAAGGGEAGLPQTTSRTIKQPSENRQKARTSKSRDVASEFADLLEGVGDQHLRDWLRIRKEKRQPITRTALAGIGREAQKAGLSMAQALELCAEQGWAGFKASWLASTRNQSAATGSVGQHRPSRHHDFAGRDYGELGDLTSATPTTDLGA